MKTYRKLTKEEIDCLKRPAFREKCAWGFLSQSLP